ncbi:hypothetical protein ES705_50791 [subsurface metagenome]
MWEINSKEIDEYYERILEALSRDYHVLKLNKSELSSVEKKKYTETFRKIIEIRKEHRQKLNELYKNYFGREIF